MGKETSIFVEAEVNEPYKIVNRYGSIIYTNFEKGAWYSSTRKEENVQNDLNASGNALFLHGKAEYRIKKGSLKQIFR